MIAQAMVLTDVTKPLILTDIQLQVIGDFDVKVKIIYSGVCHTQILEAHGKRGVDKFLPHCMGHEASAVVIETGKKVSSVKVGDKVALSWIKCSGGNGGGKQHLALKSGIHVNAGPVATFASHAVVSEDRCYKLTTGIDDKVAAILGCALATGYGLVRRTASIKNGESVGIVGVGGIGLSTLVFLKNFDNLAITVFDINDKALERAREILKCETVNIQNDGAKNYINSLDCVVETSGSRHGSELAYELARRQGGRVIFSGNLSYGSKIKIDPFHILEGKKVIGCGADNSLPEEDFPIIEKIIEGDKDTFRRLITKTIPLRDLEEAFRLIKNGDVTRVVLDCAL